VKLIDERLVGDIQTLLDNAVHKQHTWFEVAAVKRALMALEDAPEEQCEDPGS